MLGPNSASSNARCENTALSSTLVSWDCYESTAWFFWFSWYCTSLLDDGHGAGVEKDHRYYRHRISPVDCDPVYAWILWLAKKCAIWSHNTNIILIRIKQRGTLMLYIYWCMCPYVPSNIPAYSWLFSAAIDQRQFWILWNDHRARIWWLDKLTLELSDFWPIIPQWCFRM